MSADSAPAGPVIGGAARPVPRVRTVLVATVLLATVLSGCSGEPAAPQESASAGKPSAVNAQTVVEQDLPGDPSWRDVRTRGSDMTALSGYADPPSVPPGDPVDLHVSTTAQRYRVVAYRMGDYDGAGARRVWESGRLPGEQQTAQGYLAATRTPYARWRTSTTVDTTGWPPGAYLFRLIGSNGAEQYVPLVVRSRETTGRVVLVIPDTTSQVYNTWGARSAYTGPGGFEDRSRVVSYSRPYVEGYGAGRYLFLAHPVVALAEQLRLPVGYVAASDLDTSTGLLAGAEGVVMLGHDEYWSPHRRDEVTAARNTGSDLAFLGANTMYWRIRFEDGPQGLPAIAVYKSAAEDPARGRAATARFRDPPAAEPERSLVGMDYECFPATGTYAVTDPGFFLFRGTGVGRSDRLAGIVGVEVDRAYPLPGTPANLQIVANNPTQCAGAATVSNSTYYSTDSGSGVFATGTIAWITRGLRTFAVRDPRRVPRDSHRFVRRVTSNLLTAMAAGPMGDSHPARGNIGQFDLSTVNTTGAA